VAIVKDHFLSDSWTTPDSWSCSGCDSKGGFRVHVAGGRGKKMRALTVDDAPLMEALPLGHTAVQSCLSQSPRERIHEALDLAEQRKENETSAQLLNALLRLETLLSKAARIAIKMKGKIVFLELQEVAIVEAAGNYVRLHLHSGSFVVRESIARMADRLKLYGFVRIHRSVLVNNSSIEEIRLARNGEYLLRVKGGKEYTVSRTYRKNLKFFTPL